MKLYFSPGACSLADHIALHEAGLSFEHEKVDLRAKKTESGADFTKINPKGYVPALVLDDGSLLTENVAILDWVATQNAKLGAEGPMGRTRLLEMLAFVSTEVHKQFKPLFMGAAQEDQDKAKEAIAKRLQYLADNLKADYLMGDHPTAPDCYLFVMIMWSQKVGVAIPPALTAYFDRMKGQASVQTAMKHEGLLAA